MDRHRTIPDDADIAPASAADGGPTERWQRSVDHFVKRGVTDGQQSHPPARGLLVVDDGVHVGGADRGVAGDAASSGVGSGRCPVLAAMLPANVAPATVVGDVPSFLASTCSSAPRPGCDGHGSSQLARSPLAVSCRGRPPRAGIRLAHASWWSAGRPPAPRRTLRAVTPSRNRRGRCQAVPSDQATGYYPRF